MQLSFRRRDALGSLLGTFFLFSVFGLGAADSTIRQFSYFSVVAIAFLTLFLKANLSNRVYFGASAWFAVAYLSVVLLSIRDPSDTSALVFFLYNFVCVLAFILSAGHSSSGVLRLSPAFFATFAFFAGCAHLFAFQVYANPNYAAAVLAIAFLLCMPTLSNRARILVSVFFLACMLLLGSRAVLLALFVAFFTAGVFFSKFGLIARWMNALILCCIVAILGAVSVSYYNDPLYWNQLFLDISGKRLESGRVDIWSAVLSGLSSFDLIFGTGAGGSYETGDGVILSVHSSYVFLLLRVGILGLVIFVFFIAVRFFELLRQGKFWESVAVIFFVIRDFFETTLVANSIGLALFFWIFALGGNFPTKRGDLSETNPPEPLYRRV